MNDNGNRIFWALVVIAALLFLLVFFGKSRGAPAPLPQRKLPAKVTLGPGQWSVFWGAQKYKTRLGADGGYSTSCGWHGTWSMERHQSGWRLLVKEQLRDSDYVLSHTILLDGELCGSIQGTSVIIRLERE